MEDENIETIAGHNKNLLALALISFITRFFGEILFDREISNVPFVDALVTGGTNLLVIKLISSFRKDNLTLTEIQIYSILTFIAQVAASEYFFDEKIAELVKYVLDLSTSF